MDTSVPELKSTVYLLPEVAWPIIKQAVANAGNHAVLWGDFSCACLILRLLVTRAGNMAGFRASLWVLPCLFSWACRSDCQLRSWLSYNLSVYLFIGTLVKTKIPTTTGIYLRYETKQGRWELTTAVIPRMALAWLKINLQCLIQWSLPDLPEPCTRARVHVRTTREKTSGTQGTCESPCLRI